MYYSTAKPTKIRSARRDERGPFFGTLFGKIAMSEALRELERRFEDALAFADRGDNVRASELLLACVLENPGNSDYVAEFLAQLEEDQPPQTASPFDDLTTAAMEQANAEQNWAQILATGPMQLPQHPWHLPTLLALADACAAEGHEAAGVCYLRHARKAAPENVAINRRLGRLLNKLGCVSEALAAWRRVEAASADDTEAIRMVSRLTVLESRQRAGLEPIAPTQLPQRERRGNKPNEPTGVCPVALAKSVIPANAADIERTPIQQLECAIREMPSNPDFYVALTPLYLEKGRDYDAERLLAEGRKATDDEPRVRKLWEDVAMRRLQKRISLAKKQVDAEGTPEARRALAELCEERNHLEMEIFVGRCKREPENALLRYELGMRLKQAGKLREARVRFEEALASPEAAGPAACEIAACHEQEGQLPEALKFYRRAAQAARGPEQLDCHKKALYHAGSLALRLKLDALAERYLNDLLKIDPHYEDAATWLQR
jgi:tetratricopeptide (TPR) repeat protein